MDCQHQETTLVAFLDEARAARMCVDCGHLLQMAGVPVQRKAEMEEKVDG